MKKEMMKLGHDAHADGHEHAPMPLSTYFIVFGILLFLTILTVVVSYLDLGGVLAIAVALIVATIKAVLVGAFFMHLLHEEGFNKLIAVSSVLFMILFFSITLVDLQTRGTIIPEQDNWTLRKEIEAANPKPTAAPDASHGTEH